jgi:hypothetical protein
MKITLNELKNFVRNVIKEEDEKTPMEKLNDALKLFRGHFRGGERSLVPNVQKLEKYSYNIDKEAFSKEYNLLNNSLNVLEDLLKTYNEIVNKPSIIRLKTQLPEFIEIAIKLNNSLAIIFETSKDEELKGYTRPIQFNIGGMRQAANNMLAIISTIETNAQQNTPQQQNNTPQQQTNTAQQQNTPKPQNNELGAKLQQMKDDVKVFNRSFENLKYKYIDDNISEKMFSDSVNQILAPIENSITSILNLSLSESYLSRNKKSKRNIFENSFKISAVDNYFDELIMDLNRYANKLDENMGIEQVKGQLSTIRNIIQMIKDNLQKLVNNPI